MYFSVLLYYHCLERIDVSLPSALGILKGKLRPWPEKKLESRTSSDVSVCAASKKDLLLMLPSAVYYLLILFDRSTLVVSFFFIPVTQLDQ